MDGLFSDAFKKKVRSFFNIYLRTDLTTCMQPRDLSAGTLLPPSVKLTRKDGVWFIDGLCVYICFHIHFADIALADKDVVPEPPNDLLTALGHVGEKLFTASADDFARFRNDYQHENKEKWEAEQLNVPQAYAYSQHGSLLMRSQIDCRFPNQPEKTFDIKTRATVSIRLDRMNHEQGAYYQLKRQEGLFESYERENYDLMRSAYLKYSMQARIGGVSAFCPHCAYALA